MFARKLKAYQQLVKLNLSLLVLCSSLVGYIIIPDLKVTWVNLFFLFLGGLLVTSAANANNQLLEKESDKLMKRTQNRPIPEERIGKVEAIIFIVLTLFAGCFVLYQQFNLLTAALSFLSYALYAFAYTPMKKVSAIAVLIGAIPGSLPCLIGWAAGTNDIGSFQAWTLFLIQFFWQFPHFWSIAWLSHEEYMKAGMNLLPGRDKSGSYTAYQSFMYSLVLIPMSVLPKLMGLGGLISFGGLLIAALWMCYHAYVFLKNQDDQHARKVMFASFVYLPLVLISLVVDKYF